MAFFTAAESRQTAEASTSKVTTEKEGVHATASTASNNSASQPAGTVEQIPLTKLPEKPVIMRPCRAADTSFVSFQLFTETMFFDW